MTVASGAAAEIRVEYSQIEQGLATLRGHKDGDRPAFTRAAFWNVIAHTSTPEHQALASETLTNVSAAVPQRTIIVRANPSGDPEMASYISANIHPYGGGNVYSEEISLVASGDRVHRLAPLVNSLLIPDMSAAVWWLGDLPAEREEYVEALLAPADRLIVDSVHFDSAADLDLMSRIAERTVTAPADLNWVRLEEWRAATASIFDPIAFRGRLRSVRKVRVVSGTSDHHYFGETIEAILFASWLSAQLGHHVDANGKVEGSQGAIDYTFESRRQTTDVGGVAFAEIDFDDGSSASISRDRDRGFLATNVDGTEGTPRSITRARGCRLDELIIRQLKRQDKDRVFVKALPIATRLAKRLNR